jgi:hypothetical protein
MDSKELIDKVGDMSEKELQERCYKALHKYNPYVSWPRSIFKIKKIDDNHLELTYDYCFDGYYDRRETRTISINELYETDQDT